MSLHETLGHVHRAWWITAVAAAAIVAAGAFGTLPGLLVGPLHAEYGWAHGTTGLVMWITMALNGLVAPFAAALMGRFGPRRVASAALALVALGAGLTTVMTAPWQFAAWWGLLVGLGTGTMGGTLAAVVTDRWFVRRRGLATGILTAASVFGQFVFLPVLAAVVERAGWRSGTVTVALAALVVLPLVALLLRDHPADTGSPAYGATDVTPPPPPRRDAFRQAFQILAEAARTRTFWLLAATFAICGVSTNGVMWTHFVPAAGDHGMAPTSAASLLTLVGVFNVAGTVVSGWLTDRYDPRRLLAVYYALRGISLLVLPSLLGPAAAPPLIAFVVLFGLLDVATVPPTLALSVIRGAFDRGSAAVVFGWAFAAHQVGAGLMALGGGLVRDLLGAYTMMWVSAALLCLVAAVLALLVPRPGRPRGSEHDGHGEGHDGGDGDRHGDGRGRGNGDGDGRRHGRGAGPARPDAARTRHRAPALRSARSAAGEPLYDVVTCTPTPGDLRTDADFTVHVPRGPEVLETAGTVIVPAAHLPDETMTRGRLGPALADAFARIRPGTRVASICTGSFALAAAGLLDGRHATTHWLSAGDFRRLYPGVHLDPGVLYTDGGDVLTSAGEAAGIDLCLHMIRSDHGAAVANEVARRTIVPPYRDGGQAQYIPRPVTEPASPSTRTARAWALEHLDEPIVLRDLAARESVSVRTFTRRFRREVGTSPAEWLTRQRVDRARELLESTDMPVERIAAEVGFGTAAALRERLRAAVGVSPRAYRRTFRGPGHRS